MSKEYYKLYIENNIQLAETIVIKSEWDAISINESVRTDFGSSSVNDNDPASWKYYKNICGEYHSTDDMIYITSLDTVQTIAFTKANLATHPMTREAYRYESRYYRELLLENPGKEQLILGILHPADMTKALNSRDGTILSYPPYLVEFNEVGFIARLQAWVDNYLVRWYNLQFNNNHALYHLSHKAVMALNMLPHILNLRLRACKTDEVHSFHVREYLASHGGLDKYLEFFTREQALFFYFNIRWFERFGGSRESFDWLVENVLTRRGIPLSRFTMRHDVAKLPDEIYPEITFVKSPVNSVFSQDDAETTNYNLDRILEKETPLAPYNARFINEERQIILEKFIDSRSNVVQTKMLESSVVDYTDATPYTLQDIAFHHWGYLAQKGIYTAFVRFNNPRSGTEILLKGDEAFIYYMFLMAKASGVSHTNMPNYRGWRVASLPASTVPYLMEVVNTSEMETSKAQDLINSMPTINSLGTVALFTAKARQLYDAAQYQMGMVSLEQTHSRRGYVQNMVNRLYQDAVVDFTGGQNINFNQWVAERGLPNAELTQLDCFEICQVMYESATGISVRTTEQMAALQRAMLSVMTDLSSYSIQFLATINSSAVTPLHWAAIRPDDLKVLMKDELDVELPDTTVVDSINTTFDELDIELEPIIVGGENTSSSSNSTILEIPVKVMEDENLLSQTLDINIYNFSIDSALFDAPPVGRVLYPSSFQPFYDLNDQERQTIVSVYDPVIRINQNTHVDMSDSLLRDTLGSFHYLNFTKPVLNSFKFIYLPSIITSGIRSVISAELDGLKMTGGRWRVPGMILLGHESVLDIYIKTNDVMKVDGITYSGVGLTLPVSALKALYGIGTTLQPIVLVTEHRSYEYNNTFQSVISTVKYSIDHSKLTLQQTTDLTSISMTTVTEHYTSPMKFNSERYVMGMKYVRDFAAFNLNYKQTDFSISGLTVVSDAITRVSTYLLPDSYRASSGAPFFGDRDTFGKPHYRLGSFVVDGGSGKVDFIP